MHLRKRSRAGTSSNTVGAETIFVPQEVANAIVREIWDNWPRSLYSCSRICSSMMWPCTAYLFRRIVVSTERLDEFVIVLGTSRRLLVSIKELFIRSEERPNLTQIRLDHIFTLIPFLPRLESLRLGWVFVSRPPRIDLPRHVTRPRLSNLRFDYVDPQTVECVFAALDSVDTVTLHGKFTDGDSVHRPLRPARARTVELHLDPGFMSFGMKIFDMSCLRDMVLDFGEVQWAKLYPLDAFLQMYGPNIETLTFVMPSRGIFPERGGECCSSLLSRPISNGTVQLTLCRNAASYAR